jgi:hypothetical protein
MPLQVTKVHLDLSSGYSQAKNSPSFTEREFELLGVESPCIFIWSIPGLNDALQHSIDGLKMAEKRSNMPDLLHTMNFQLQNDYARKLKLYTFQNSGHFPDNTKHGIGRA